MNKGWYNESIRHSLAARGIRSKTIQTHIDVFWHHGCGPTACGMLLGYYDINFTMTIVADS